MLPACHSTRSSVADDADFAHVRMIFHGFRAHHFDAVPHARSLFPLVRAFNFFRVSVVTAFGFKQFRPQIDAHAHVPWNECLRVGGEVVIVGGISGSGGFITVDDEGFFAGMVSLAGVGGGSGCGGGFSLDDQSFFTGLALMAGDGVDVQHEGVFVADEVAIVSIVDVHFHKLIGESFNGDVEIFFHRNGAGIVIEITRRIHAGIAQLETAFIGDDRQMGDGLDGRWWDGVDGRWRNSVKRWWRNRVERRRWDGVESRWQDSGNGAGDAVRDDRGIWHVKTGDRRRRNAQVGQGDRDFAGVRQSEGDVGGGNKGGGCRGNEGSVVVLHTGDVVVGKDLRVLDIVGL